MDVIYKCRCMAAERKILVTDRVAGTGIMDWMPLMQSSINYDHSARNPRCLATEMEYARIAMPQDGGEIGVPTTKN